MHNQEKDLDAIKARLLEDLDFHNRRHIFWCAVTCRKVVTAEGMSVAPAGVWNKVYDEKMYKEFSELALCEQHRAFEATLYIKKLLTWLDPTTETSDRYDEHWNHVHKDNNPGKVFIPSFMVRLREEFARNAEEEWFGISESIPLEDFNEWVDFVLRLQASNFVTTKGSLDLGDLTIH